MQFQKALLLLGKGGTGKSTFLKLLCWFLGLENCSHLSLDDLEDRFRPAQLVGKLLNSFADLPSGILRSTAVFRLITGEDPIEAERKFGAPFSFSPFARACFSVNSFPRVQDASEAFFDRWLVIKFDCRFRGTDQQIDQDKLIADLTTPQELSGALNRALEVLPKLLVHGFPTTESSRRGALELEAQSSPVRAWLTEHVTLKANAFVIKDWLLAHYNAAATRAGRPTLTAMAFSLEVKKHFGASLDEKQKTVGDGRPWCWIGIGFNAQLELVDQKEVIQ